MSHGARFSSIEDMPPKMRALFDKQYVSNSDAEQMRKQVDPYLSITPPPKICVNQTSGEFPFRPYSAMNVGADETTIAGMNKTERRYWEILKAREDLLWVGAKTMRFRLAGNTHFTPDFQTLDKDGIFSQIDTKGGYTREDAQLKIKLAARMLPMFRWVKVILLLATASTDESVVENVIKS